MKKYYGVVVINVKNWDEYNKYAALAGPILKKHTEKCGGKILSRGGDIINIEGTEMNRIVLVEFERRTKWKYICIESNPSPRTVSKLLWRFTSTRRFEDSQNFRRFEDSQNFRRFFVVVVVFRVFEACMI